MELTREKKNRRKRLVDATRNTEILTLASTKSQSVWNSVKAQMKTISPLPEFWHRRSTESTRPQVEAEPRWPQDEEEGLFCESLLGLMQRFKRYDFLKAKSQQLFSVVRSRSRKQKEFNMDVDESQSQVVELELVT